MYLDFGLFTIGAESLMKQDGNIEHNKIWITCLYYPTMTYISYNVSSWWKVDCQIDPLAWC